MPSLTHQILRGIFRFRKWLSIENSSPNYSKMRRFNFSEEKVLRKYGDQVRIEKVNGHAVYSFQRELPRTLVWFHGGGYVRGPISLHFKRWIELCKLTQSHGLLLDYPKAPEYSHEDTKKYLEEFSKKFLTLHSGTELYFVGDSAGGGLALAYALQLQKNNKKVPTGVFLFSPWLDLSFSQKNLPEYAIKDVMLNQKTLEQHAQHYANGTSLKNEWISPLFSSEKMIHFPLHLYSTPDELLHSAVIEFKNKYPEVILHEHPHLFHAWPLMPLRESDQVILEVANLIRAQVPDDTQTRSIL
jgi:monoterpene epsilon-lactone hydrolase